MTASSRLVSAAPYGSVTHGDLIKAHQSGLSLIDISRKFAIDLALIPHDFRAPKLVVFDMDSTLIKAEVIDELAIEAGVGEKVKHITERAMQGELNFDQSLKERVLLLKGLPVSALQKVYERIEFNPGVEKCLAALHMRGIQTAIASGGFKFFAHLFAARLKMNYVFANELEIKQGNLTGEILGEIFNAQKKADTLRILASQNGWTLSQVVAVGDGANDLPMLAAAGLGVAFYAKEKVQREAQALINYGSMTTLLTFLELTPEAQDGNL